MTPDTWRADIALLERELDLEGGLRRAEQDAYDLAEAIGSFARTVVDLPALDLDYRSARQFDIAEVRKLYEELQAEHLEDAEFPWPGREEPIRASDALKALSAHLASFDPAQARYGELEAGLRLQLAIDKQISHILLCVTDASLLGRVVALVQAKLATGADSEILDLWGNVVHEFQESSFHGHLPKDADIIPEKFFEPANHQEMCGRIAIFAVWLRERLRAKAVELGHQSFPALVPGVGSILAARASLVRPIQDRRLATCLARICGLLPEEALATWCRATGLSQDGWIANSEHHLKRLDLPRNGREQPSPQSKARMLLRQLDRLVLYLDGYVSLSAPIDRALLQHRLGLEVTLPSSRKEIIPKNEVELQKRLCRFLLERGVYAVGTKFGQSEIDLLTNAGPSSYVIETKIYKSAPTPNKILKDLAQLQVYMGQQPLAPRGVLLIYNLSERAIIADRIWIEGRYHVLAINLPKVPPSGARQTLLVRRGEGAELLSFVANEPVGGQRPEPRTRRKKRG